MKTKLKDFSICHNAQMKWGTKNRVNSHNQSEIKVFKRLCRRKMLGNAITKNEIPKNVIAHTFKDFLELSKNHKGGIQIKRKDF